MRLCQETSSKYMRGLRNEGFTFIEMIGAFSIFIIIASFFPLFFQLFAQNGFGEERLQRMEWEVFVAQVKKEVRLSDSLRVEGNRLWLEKNNENIVYEGFGQTIRRRVNLQGHEITLQNIRKVTFEEVIKGVRITVEDQYNQIQTVMIRSIVDKDELYGP